MRFEEQINRLRKEKRNVLEDINSLSADIDKIHSEHDVLVSRFNLKKDSLTSRHAQDMDKLKQETEAIDEEYTKFKEECAIRNNKEKQENLLGKLEQERNDKKASHDARLQEINNDYAKQVDDLSKHHEELLAKAQASHDALVNELYAKFDKQKADLLQEDEDRKNKLEEAKEAIIKNKIKQLPKHTIQPRKL